MIGQSQWLLSFSCWVNWLSTALCCLLSIADPRYRTASSTISPHSTAAAPLLHLEHLQRCNMITCTITCSLLRHCIPLFTATNDLMHHPPVIFSHMHTQHLCDVIQLGNLLPFIPGHYHQLSTMLCANQYCSGTSRRSFFWFQSCSKIIAYKTAVLWMDWGSKR